MGKISRPRRGSLQFWPRKRARKLLPSITWSKILERNNEKNLLGFIGYKVGMATAYVLDNTPDSMTKNKRIVIPVTLVECPSVKILSARFYKNSKVISEVLSNSLNKELRRKIKVPKEVKKKLEDVKDYDDIKVIVYSNVKTTAIKKTPDVAEIGLGGSLENKMNFVKENLDKEIAVKKVFENMQVVDIRGVTKGKGIQGAVKRFGIGLRQHKAEKGRRRVGSLGPWHPAHVTFRTPMAGQTGLFTRAIYNSKIIDIGNIHEKNINKKSGFKKFGNIKTDYIILGGSISGPAKRAVLITYPLRVTRKQSKKMYNLIELR